MTTVSNPEAPEKRSTTIYVLGQIGVALFLIIMVVILISIVSSDNEIISNSIPIIVPVYAIAAVMLCIQFQMFDDMIWLIEGRNADILAASASASASASEPATDETEQSISPNPVAKAVYTTPPSEPFSEWKLYGGMVLVIFVIFLSAYITAK